MRGSIDRGDHRFRPRFVRGVDVWKDSSSRDGTLSSPGGAGPINPGLVFDTVRGGMDPEDRRFRLRFVGVVDQWNDHYFGDWTLSSQVALALRTPGWVSTLRGVV